MNIMMKAVVDEGTAKRAALDFTYAVGKTGTSSSYRDAWFLGFTGALVTGVWVGYDDFRPMSWNSSGVTGGRSAGNDLAQLHVGRAQQHQIHSANPRPAVASQPGRRAAATVGTEAVDPGGPGANRAGGAKRKTTIMPDQTREMLKRLADTLRRANGQEAVPPARRQRPRNPARRRPPIAHVQHRPLPTVAPRCRSPPDQNLIAFPDHAPIRQVVRQPHHGAVLGIDGGLGSAWYMVEAGSRLTTRSYGLGAPGSPPAAPTPIRMRARAWHATACCRLPPLG